ncbi:glycosyltransferase family 4 protein [Natronococcus sp. A-GB1]|uniref:glycosyltransferase family 4 protein n=1 Tax=Natronococcus sp. A-GB1 TaxID=3037648 RepID=UPI00241D6D72|nr:glycosyltransferase family 4 protein [Natronococcus sp. A-GB1]MDG5761756.1 glycosyltransferase family 4 protein [Natronococcus sp. A-GB1]
MPAESPRSSDSLRILRVAQTIYPDVKGGGAYHVHALSRDQAALGHDVTVLTVRHDPTAPHLEKRCGYTVVRYDPSVAVLGNEISTGVAQHLRTAAAFDVVHAHSHLYFSTNLAALKRLVGGPPLAITNHGLYSQTASKRLFEWYLRTIGRWTFNRADLVFCYTDVEKRHLRGIGVTTPVAVVSNGVDTDRFSPTGPESTLLEATGPVILFVGRLVEGKRPEDALKAMATVRESHPEATLYLCGDGPLRGRLERQAGDTAGQDVVFLGHVPYDEMPRVYRSADVLVLPSRAEGVPRTVLEAMASGTRVVCSDLEQLRPIVDGAGAVAPVGDVPAFAAAIRDQLSVPTADRPSRASTYEWHRTVTAVTDRLRQLVRS